MLLLKLDQLAFPMAELIPGGDGAGKMQEAAFRGETLSVAPSHAFGAKPAAMHWQVQIELLASAVLGVGEAVDRLMTNPLRVYDQSEERLD